MIFSIISAEPTTKSRKDRQITHYISDHLGLRSWLTDSIMVSKSEIDRLTVNE